jgi:hypothetical protein
VEGCVSGQECALISFVQLDKRPEKIIDT